MEQKKKNKKLNKIREEESVPRPVTSQATKNKARCTAPREGIARFTPRVCTERQFVNLRVTTSFYSSGHRQGVCPPPLPPCHGSQNRRKRQTTLVFYGPRVAADKRFSNNQLLQQNWLLYDSFKQLLECQKSLLLPFCEPCPSAACFFCPCHPHHHLSVLQRHFSQSQPFFSKLLCDVMRVGGMDSYGYLQSSTRIYMFSYLSPSFVHFCSKKLILISHTLFL